MFKPANKKSQVLGYKFLWSSSEYSANRAYIVPTYDGIVYDYSKGITDSVKAFAALA